LKKFKHVDEMDKVLPYDIILVRGTSIISYGIKYFTKSPYSHVALVVSPFMTFETDYKFPSTIRNLSYNKRNYEIYRLKEPLTNKQKQQVNDYIYNHVNDKYDWRLIFSRMFHILFKTPIVQNRKRLNCDELIVNALKSANVDLIGNRTFYTPEIVAESKKLYKVN